MGYLKGLGTVMVNHGISSSHPLHLPHLSPKRYHPRRRWTIRSSTPHPKYPIHNAVVLNIEHALLDIVGYCWFMLVYDNMMGYLNIFDVFFK